MTGMNWHVGVFRVWATCILLGLVAAGCGGGNSSPPPPPTLTTLAPDAAVAGGADLVVTATGSGYTRSSIVKWNGSALTTNYVSPTSLTATIPASDLAAPGTSSVTVTDPSNGDAGSAVVQFKISDQTAPTIVSLAPSTLTPGGPSFQLTITGTNFAPTAKVMWNGIAIPTIFDSATQLLAQVTAAQIAVAASVAVTVVNDTAAGGTSNISTFTVTSVPPVPSLTSVSPSSVPAFSSGITLTLTGTGFTTSTVVLVNNFVLTSTYVSSTQITVGPMAFSDVSGTTLTLTVEDPASGNVPSNGVTLNFTPAIPVAASVAPSTVIAAQGALSLTVSGQYFTSTAAVYFNGNSRPTTLNNQGQLVAQLTAQDVAVAGTATITVEDPASGNVPSNVLSFVIQPLPSLALSSLSPATVPTGNAAFTLTVFGTGFTTNSTVALNGTPLTTIYVSASTLSAAVSAAQVATVGSASITVVNPANQGGTSSPLTLTIVAPSIDAVSYQINNGHSGFVAFKSATLPSSASWSVNIGGEPSYALIVGGIVYVTASVNGNSELFALNGTTGATVWGPIAFAGVTGITYDAGRIFVDSGTYISTGILSALDATTGNAIWSATVPGSFSTQSPPVAAEGLVYTLDDGVLTAFNETNGAQVWQQAVSGTNGSPALTVDGIYTAPVCFAIDLQPATGAMIWSTNTGCSGGGGNTPVVGGGRMFAPLSPGYYAGNVYSAESGQVLGAFSASATPAISTSNIFMLDNSTLQGIALSNNQILWSFAGDGTLVNSPIAVNNYVFVGSSSGNLYALDATTGAQVWTMNLGAPITGPATGGSATQGATGLSAGDGLLIVPAGNTVNAFVLSTNP
ncbi:MAG: PQQ-binding-like beta-propeller repeat protein [Pseudomonadota bacterium]|nr:PQQ-binding-like beta-propeller repeat protein [Pseudomonadota bacterium]